MSKAKVIELVGVKLDPKAKYLILVEPFVHPDMLQGISEGLIRLIGPNFTIGIVPDPQNSVKVFEFVPPPADSQGDKHE